MRVRSHRLVPLWLALLCAALPARANPSAAPSTPTAQALADVPAPTLWVRVQGGQRLSESWLKTRRDVVGGEPGEGGGARTQPYALGLMWIAPAARPAQRAQLRGLLADLQRVAEQVPMRRVELQALRQELASMPVTGRVPLPAQDLYWLQANPAYDPVLADGDEWWLPAQPGIVRVWISSGERCDLPFRPQALAAAYVAACASPASASGEMADEVLVVQPDARVQSIGIAAWNGQLQAPPAPGAWIWAPRRDSGMTGGQHAALAAWLSTQGPAGAATVPSAEPLGRAPATSDPAPVLALGFDARATRPEVRALPLLASDWGITGLLQTPTARTRPAGSFGATITRTPPYTHVNLVLSPFDRVELAVRYSNLSNHLYGPDIAGDQSYKDKSAELKLRLLDEGTWTPAVAVGLRDPGGTGLFGGEYVVASKRWGDLDASLGLGWGYLGGRGNLGNPLSRLGLRPQERQGAQIATGGTANLNALFSGPTALFGGLQWHTPWDDVVLKLEWDGNDHQREPLGSRFDVRSALQAGVTWRWGDAELGLSWQRGNQWSFSLAWLGSLPALGVPKLAVPRMPTVDEPARAASAVPSGSVVGAQPGAGAVSASVPTVPAEAATAQVGALGLVVPSEPVDEARRDARARQDHAILVELAEHTGWHATRLERQGERWTAWFDHAGGAYVQERIERVWAVLHREAPPSVTQLAIELASRQLPMARHEVDRAAWADARSRYLARHQRGEADPLASAPPPQEPSTTLALTPSPDDTPRLATGLNLAFQQHLAGPDGYLYALSARAFGQIRAWSGAWLQGSLNLRLVDNYDRFRYTAPSALPRVRTHIREYVTSRAVTMPNLQFTQVARLAEGLYGMAYAGWLEPMFAGVGGELLYRPLNSRWAVGLDLNVVRKRDFEQDFGLQDYQVATGHLTARWDTGWHDLVVGASAGQYLAGDRGVTVDLARVFPNGTRMGAWVTRTNVSAAQFGEGSFDKGLYVSVPFDAMFTSWSGSALTVAWQPLIRDGGAKLQRGASLWGLTDVRDQRVMGWRSATPDAAGE